MPGPTGFWWHGTERLPDEPESDADMRASIREMRRHRRRRPRSEPEEIPLVPLPAQTTEPGGANFLESRPTRNSVQPIESPPNLLHSYSMTGRTHDLFAFTCLTIIAISQPLPDLTLSTVILSVGSNLIGGIAPDIDEPTAPFWRNLPPGKIIGKIFDKLIGGHRFISHSLIGAGLFGLLFYLLLNFLHPIMPSVNITVVWWSFFIGLLSHLIADTFTKEGVPWLLPIPYKLGIPPIRAFRITAGGLVENIIIFPGLLLVTGYLYYSHYARFLELFHHS